MVRKPGQAKNKMTFQQDLLAGTMAGLFQMTITYPIETVRTRMTLSKELAGGISYRGIGHCFVETAKREGVSALYKGFGVAVLSGAPYVGLQMSIYKLAQQMLPTRADGSSPVYWKLASGAAAGLVAQSLMYPGDTLRRRMQTNGIGGESRTYTSTWHCCQVVMRKEGIRGFYRGLVANSLKAFPLAGFQFLFFDLLKALLKCA
jgi:solute carrier family 25 phosphate transporter 23/24/25/41